MLKQSLQQRLLQKLSPQQIQLMKLLQVPTALLEQRIKEEMEMNPALEEGEETDDDEFKNEEDDSIDNNEEENSDETIDTREEKPEERLDDDVDVEEYIQDEDIPYYKTSVSNNSSDDEQTDIPISVTTSFSDHLHNQLSDCSLNDRQFLIAEQIIGSIDDDGYLRRDLTAIIDDIVFAHNIQTDEKELVDILKVIQTFEPAGVGARDLRECLMLQLERKSEKNASINIARKIVRDFMDEFSKKHYEKIEKNLYLTEEQLKDSVHEILRLNPRPGNTFSEGTKSAQHVVPDFIITNNDGNLELTLNSRNAPDLRISREYTDMLLEYSKNKKKNSSSKEAVAFVKQKLDSAKWFIDAIKQRQLTLITTMQAIMDYQQEYFITGDEKTLKPMILKDIADVVGLDISTISRVANSKYVQTQFGTFLLKTFFSESLSTDSGEEVSSREVKKILSDAIAAEGKIHPLPDEKLVQILKDKGYNIARRTVAKYREQLNIPVARLRKEL